MFYNVPSALLVLLVALAIVNMPVMIHAQDDDGLTYPDITEEGCTSLPKLISVVTPTEGNNASGLVTFTPVWEMIGPNSVNGDPNGMSCFTLVEANITMLTPNSAHGFHIHTYGDLSDPAGSSTGGHFTNPAGDDIPHGYPGDKVRHWGDLGNLSTDADGVANFSEVDKVIRLGGVVGRGITIHEENDKGVDSQPSGGSGSRIAYGVIGYAKPLE